MNIGDARVFDDGSLAFPNRGTPPTVMPGYERDPGDPFILRPLMPECEFRVRGETKRNCGHCRSIVFLACTEGNKVTGIECQKCIESGRRETYRVLKGGKEISG